MMKRTIFASLFLLGTAGCTMAQDHGPRLIGGGGDGGPRVEYAEPSQNLIGGGFAHITGDSSSRSVAYSGPTTAQEQSGFIAQLVGGGLEQKLVRVPAPATDTSIAGQTSHHGG